MRDITVSIFDKKSKFNVVEYGQDAVQIRSFDRLKKKILTRIKNKKLNTKKSKK